MSGYFLWLHRFFLVVCVLALVAVCVVAILIGFDVEYTQRWANGSLVAGALTWVVISISFWLEASKDLDKYDSSAENAKEDGTRIKEGFNIAAVVLIIAVLVCLANVNVTLRGFATYANAILAFLIICGMPPLTMHMWTPVFEKNEKISQ